MVDAGGGPVEQRKFELLGDLIGLFDEVLGLLGVGRLDHGDERKSGVITVVLFVLRTVCGRVVGGHDEHSGADTGICEGHQGIGGDVQSDVFHEDERPDTRGCGSGGDLDGDLFVRRELKIHSGTFGILLEEIADLGRGGTGIGRCKFHACLEETSGDGLVSEQELLL